MADSISKNRIQASFDQINRAGTSAAAFGEIYDIYYQRIFNFLYRRSRNLTATEDLTADTFFKALNGIKNFKPTNNTSLECWLFKIAHNELIRYYELQDRYLPQYKGQDAEIDTFLSIPDPDNEVEQLETELEHNKQFTALQTAMQNLETRTQTVIDLFYFAEKSYAEIAEITGISEVNLRSIAHRGVAQLKNIINNATT